MFASASSSDMFSVCSLAVQPQWICQFFRAFKLSNTSSNYG